MGEVYDEFHGTEDVFKYTFFDSCLKKLSTGSVVTTVDLSALGFKPVDSKVTENVMKRQDLAAIRDQTGKHSLKTSLKSALSDHFLNRISAIQKMRKLDGVAQNYLQNLGLEELGHLAYVRGEHRLVIKLVQ